MTRRVGDGHSTCFAELSIPFSSCYKKILSELATSWVAGLVASAGISFHERYVRPVRWLCVLFGSEIVPFLLRTDVIAQILPRATVFLDLVIMG